jgi:DNA-binding XRE family transcriptional regulator
MFPIGNSKQFGKLVRDDRRRQRLSQQEAADLAGVSVRFLGDLERGKPTCELEISLAVAATLGLRLVFEDRE